jgi:hypothetical protein
MADADGTTGAPIRSAGQTQPERPGTRMVVYTPDNDTTRATIGRFVSDPVQHHFPCHHFPCWPTHQARTRNLVPA